MKKNVLSILLILILLLIVSCNFFKSIVDPKEEEVSLLFSKTKLFLSVGEMDLLELKSFKNQNEKKVTWEYDTSFISAKTDNYGAIITPLKPGNTTITAKVGSSTTSCVITIAASNYTPSISNPYVYASTDLVELKPSETVKISGSLFGGTPADNTSFKWTIDKPSIASIATEGNYCWITGMTEGFARLTLSHSKAPYTYSTLISVSNDGTVMPYITSTQNILTINKSEKETDEIQVQLKNPLTEGFLSDFIFKTVNEKGEVLTNAPVLITSVNGDIAQVTAIESGICYIRITHPEALYPLDILVRVIENAEIAYIEPSETMITVNDKKTEYISLSVLNTTEEINPSLFTWRFSDFANQYIDYTIVNGKDENTGNGIYIKGIKTGSVKLYVSYPGLEERTIVVLVRDIATEAKDVTTYITTSQNYIKLKPQDETTISIILKNCKANDIKDLHWDIIQDPEIEGKEVISWISGNGTSKSTFLSRAIISDYNENATGLIKALSPGKAYIDVSHPKAVYKTRITITVTNEITTIEKPYLSLTTSPLYTIQNGETQTVYVSLNGINAHESDIVWSVEEGPITLSSNGTTAVISAPPQESGASKNTVKASIADSSVFFSILTYDTLEELQEMQKPFIYTLNPQYTLFPNKPINLYIETEFIEDFSFLSWSVIKGNDNVSLENNENNNSITIHPMALGEVQIKASYPQCDDVIFTILIVNPEIENPTESVYLSTNQNVLHFEEENQSNPIYITAYNLSLASQNDIQWHIDNPHFDIAANGASALITCNKLNENALLTVTHSLSENELKIYIISGSQFVYENENVAIITTDKDIIQLKTTDTDATLYASLHYTEKDEEYTKNFSFISSDESIASVSFVNYSNYCYITPKNPGTCKIVITHPDSLFEKEVIITVQRKGDGTHIPYITTQKNILTIVQGEYETATVELKNSEQFNNALWKWTSSNERIVSIVANNGSSAMLSANGPGVATLTITHDECEYPLSIVVTVLDKSIITQKPYIEVTDSIITIKKGTSETITAKMMGTKDESDNNFFRFSSSSSSIAFVTSSSSSASIYGNQTGMTYITVTNTKHNASYSKTVLVIVEDTIVDDVYIKPSTNIIKINPNDLKTSQIKAQLIGGNETDGKDFIWWADDYTLIGINALADTCAIQATGKTGMTKIHIKHAKAKKEATIIVYISQYDTFSFSQSSLSLSSEKLYFIPMELPPMDDKVKVSYESDNPDICIIEGSSQVAWLCGLDFGTTTVRAKLLSSDGSIIATDEMLVTVTVPDITLPIISLTNTILNVEMGSSKTLTAFIKGNNIDEDEKFNLQWSVKGGKKGLSFLNETPDKKAYGPDCYVTFNEASEYVITVTHPATGATSDIYIIVEDKGEVLISLSSSLETVYLDDGSFTLTAILTNANKEDYKNIEWSAIKIGGQNVVSVSKTKSETCTVMPITTGQTTIIARLPNGKYATCIVLVKASAEIFLDVGTVHVIPGYTEVINYRTVPENAHINWFTQMTQDGDMTNQTNFFSIEDDTTRKQLRITGLIDFPGKVAGTITAMMTGVGTAKMPKINVVVEYNVSLDIVDENLNIVTQIQNDIPDTKNTKEVSVLYYPSDLHIDFSFQPKNGSKKLISCVKDGAFDHSQSNVELLKIGTVTKKVIMHEGVEKTLLTAIIIPSSEGEGTLSVKGTLPNDTSGKYGKEQSFYYTSYYQDYDVEIDFDLLPQGAFSGYDEKNKTIILGDGEEVPFTVRIANENAKGTIKSVIWSHDTTDTEIMGTIQPIYDRKTAASKLFTNNPYTLAEWREIGKGDGQYKPKTSFISLKDTAIKNGQTLWTLRHNWDYYVDVPEFEGGSWQAHFEKNYEFIDDPFGKMKSDGFDTFLVNYEPYIIEGGKEKYFIPHTGKQTATVTWYTEIRETGWIYSYTVKDWWAYHDYYNRYYYTSLLGIVNNNYWFDSVIYNYIPPYQKTSFNNTTIKYNSNIKYKRTIPYTITLTEIINNTFFSPLTAKNKNPRNINNIPNYTYNHTNTNWFRGTSRFNLSSIKTAPFLPLKIKHLQFDSYQDNHDENNIYTNKVSTVIFKDSKNNMILVPTTSKDITPFDTKKTGNIVISYILANETGEKQKTVPVKIKKRMCEAYTNNNWKDKPVNGYSRYTISDDLFDSSVITQPIPGVMFDAPSNIYQETVEPITIPYSIYPSSNSIFITINKNAPLTINNTQVYSETSTTKTLKIKNHESTTNGEAFGTIVITPTDNCDENIQLSSSYNDKTTSFNLSVDLPISFMVEKIIATPTTNTTIQSTHSKINEEQKMIIIGDGEELKGKIHITSEYIPENILYTYTPLVTENELKENLGSDYEEYKDMFLKKDESFDSQIKNTKKTQQDLISVSFEGNEFTITHSRDYGYFASLSGIIDYFYKNDNFSLSAIDEQTLVYDTVYDIEYEEIFDEEGNIIEVIEHKTVNEEETYNNIMEAKKEALHNLKKTYASYTNVPQSTYQMPYYYEEGEIVYEENTITKTPVGTLEIKYDAGNDEEGNTTQNSIEYVVCVEIRNGPCASTSQYGYEVPYSYYSQINE